MSVKDLLGYGITIVLMSLFFYLAFVHISVSIAIAIQLGPVPQENIAEHRLTAIVR